MYANSISSCFVPQALIPKHVSVEPAGHAYAATVDIPLSTYVMYCPALLLFNYEAYSYTQITSHLCHMIQHTRGST